MCGNDKVGRIRTLADMTDPVVFGSQNPIPTALGPPDTGSARWGGRCGVPPTLLVYSELFFA